MTVELPLFALNTVLFPHMPLALHVFEPRYRQMLADCSAQGTSFGVIAIAGGHEVAGPALPNMVGTLAQIVSNDALDDGRHDLLVRGATRFQVESVSLEHAYLVAEVRWLEESPGATPDQLVTLVERASQAFLQYANGLRALAASDSDEIDLPADPEKLAYLMSATLQVDTCQKQNLLELTSTADQLRACLKVLRREVLFVDQMLTRRNMRVGLISPN
ncbi:MAG: LON peptidase substrate-binding domain-containing protein [Candidatus Dormibacteria bacterium]